MSVLDFFIKHYLLFFAALFSGFGLLVLSSRRINQHFVFGLDPSQLVQLMNQGNVVLIDLRGGEETHATGVIKGARLIPFASFRERSAASNRFGGKGIVFICKDGQQAKVLAKENRKKGGLAYYLVGGVEAWIAACLPLVKSSSK